MMTWWWPSRLIWGLHRGKTMQWLMIRRESPCEKGGRGSTRDTCADSHWVLKNLHGRAQEG